MEPELRLRAPVALSENRVFPDDYSVSEIAVLTRSVVRSKVVFNLQQSGPLDTTGLAERTGVSTQYMKKLLPTMLSEGEIILVKRPPSGRGRPRHFFGLP